MKKFRLLEHTADTGLVACGETLAEAFTNAAYGLFAIMADLRSVREKETRKITLTEEDTESLLFEWLNRLIYYFDAEALLFRRFEISGFDGRHLEAVCYGEKYDPAHHRLKTGVKSATYHLLKVDAERNRVQVILDI